MNTLDVICIVLTRQRPSCTPLARTASSTSVVIFTNSIFDGMFSVRYLVCDFMCLLVAGRRVHAPQGRIRTLEDGRFVLAILGQIAQSAGNFALRVEAVILKHLPRQLRVFALMS